ncbi:8-oxoguanine deaminase [Pelagibacterium sp.]|uniref:8-oxoguanine deaminase n=1 Tax=Pelagibacterium sp. TaxID=1967288 RepID=UPI003BA92151
MSRTVLLKNASHLVTMDDHRRELTDADIVVVGNKIAGVGGIDKDIVADEVIDMSGKIVLPGLINTHHHMYQSLTRAVPAAQNVELFGWLKRLYRIWAGLTPEMIRVSTQTAMAELILSGCTTSSDHLYIFPNGCRLDHSIEGAREVGMRFHASRGAMSVGESAGGLPPDGLTEHEGAILADSQRLIETFHDPEPGAMVRIALAPCSPFSVSRDLMRETARMARDFGVGLHTHLAENDNDVAYSLEKFGMTPAQYAEDLEWVGHDVWHAHCVKLDAPGIALFARTGTGVTHCPCSNMRLASGIAPVRDMVAAGVPVGLGVDGSASNDAGHILDEVRQAMLLQRVGHGPDAMSARTALELATRGGARVLARTDIGQIAEGMCADIVAFDLNAIGLAGALHDPVAALVFGRPDRVAFSMVNGRTIVSEGHLTTLDLPGLIARHNGLAAQLLNA